PPGGEGDPAQEPCREGRPRRTRAPPAPPAILAAVVAALVAALVKTAGRSRRRPRPRRGPSGLPGEGCVSRGPTPSLGAQGPRPRSGRAPTGTRRDSRFSSSVAAPGAPGNSRVIGGLLGGS